MSIIQEKVKKELPRLMEPRTAKNYIFNGVDGPNLNLPGVYTLFKTEGFPSMKIGRKWFASTHLILAWIDNQCLNRKK